MIKRIYLVLLCTTLMSALLIHCKKDKDDSTPDTTFDKAGMFRNIGENIIIPAYADLKTAVDNLKSAGDSFTTNPSLTTLANVQTLFLQAYTQYQRVSTFEFGPADNELIRANFNTFPCDTTQINTKIAAGDFNFSTVADLDAKGFPGLDFLLYGIQQDNNIILAAFTTDANALNRSTYLTAIINELKTKTDLVNSAWSPSGGNYLNTFINNTGTDVGSSLGLLVNQLNYDFEALKNYRIGIPLGKKSLGTPLPHEVEAYYSQISVTLALEQIKSIENIYLGRSKQGSDGPGLDEYLIHVKAQYNGGMLSDAIKTQLGKATGKLQLVPDPLSQTIISNPAVVDAAYLELQKQVVLFKTDMPSALGVLITYQDNDGD